MTPQIEDYIMPVHMTLKNVWLIFLWSLFRGSIQGVSKKSSFLRFTLHLWVQISQNPTLFTLKCTQGI